MCCPCILEKVWIEGGWGRGTIDDWKRNTYRGWMRDKKTRSRGEEEKEKRREEKEIEEIDGGRWRRTWAKKVEKEKGQCFVSFSVMLLGLL